MTAERFHATSRYAHRMIPQYEHHPDGPQVPSFVACANCDAYWNRHRCGDGACPADAKLTPDGVAIAKAKGAA